MPRSVALIATLVTVLLLAGCAASGPASAPVDRGVLPGSRPASGATRQAARPVLHRVQRGETLYAIAWRYGLDYRDLGRWNAIDAPYTIYPNQPLALSPRGLASNPPRVDAPRSVAPVARPPAPRPPAKAPAPRAPTVAVARPPQPVAAPAVLPPDGARGPSPNDASAPVSGWLWPADGKLLRDFDGTRATGIDIVGLDGAPVSAAAAGRVVYAGSGLRGYGQLIILKHNNRFLSAYAHNKKLHVAEGDEVARGERIAEMGSSGADRVMLHFEIRRDGKPVNPLSFLPRRPG